MASLKNIVDLPVAESAEGLNLIVNDNGAAKQIAASAVCNVKTINGVPPDENGNVVVEIPEGGGDADLTIALWGAGALVVSGSVDAVLAKLNAFQKPNIHVFNSEGDPAEWFYQWCFEVVGVSTELENGNGYLYVKCTYFDELSPGNVEYRVIVLTSDGEVDSVHGGGNDVPM